MSFFFFSSRRRHTRFDCDWSSDVCSSDLVPSRSQSSTCVCSSSPVPPLPSRSMVLDRVEGQGSSRLERLPGSPHPLHQTNEPRLTSQIREKRLVLGEPWRNDETRLDGARRANDRRGAAAHPRKTNHQPPREKLIPPPGREH